MANKRIKDLSTTAAVTASDDFIAVDGATNGTRKLDAYSPTFGGNLTVSGTGGVSTIRGAQSSVNAVLTLQNNGAGNDFSGLILDVAQTSPSVNSRRWLISSNYQNYGNLDIQRSTTNSGAPTTVVASFDSSSNLALAGNLTVSGGTVDVGTGKIKFTNASQILTGFTAPYVWKVYDNSAGRDVLNFNQTANTLLTGCTFLVGSGATPSGNGAIQLATHTTSAGGIGFGTDVSLYRTAIANTLGLSGGLAIIAGSNTTGFNQDSTLSNYGSTNGVYLNGNASGWLRLSGSGGGGATIQLIGGTGSSATINFTTNNSTTALTLDGSQNATFAGTIKPQQAATASAPTYVKGAIYFDTTLNKLRVGGATGWETITSV